MTRGAVGLAVALAALASCAAPPQDARERLAFRAMLQGYPNDDVDVFWDRDFWRHRMSELAGSGYNVVVWYGPGEFTNGQQMFAALGDFPDARDLAPQQSDRLIAHWKWLFACAHDHGLKNVLQTQHIFFPRGLELDAAIEPTQHIGEPLIGGWRDVGYPNFWPRTGDLERVHNCDVRSELTTRYTTAVYRELLDTYADLDGFYVYLGEPLPGRRSSFFREAIAPAFDRRRDAILIVSQWQVPLDDYVEDVASHELDSLALGFHGYNSESFTDVEPYPGLVHWARETRLPTVVDFYPGNQLFLPFNSPRLAYEVAREMKRVDGLSGFVYYERHIAGAILGPLFRDALARYAGGAEAYSDEPWLRRLEERFGNRESAVQFLTAYDLAARIIPETNALVYSGGDVLRRELRMPYRFFVEAFPWRHMTSPARGMRLVPVGHYAEFVADDREHYGGRDGSEADRPPFHQVPTWNTEGGSIYNTIPPAHMRRVRALGADCLRAAELGLASASSNVDEARVVRDMMKAYQLLASYYERKVAAAVASLVYFHSRRIDDRCAAEALADRAVDAYLEFASFAHLSLDPWYVRAAGTPLHEAGVALPELMELECEERRELASIFSWPEDPDEPDRRD